jgi:hypothetical protein
VLGLSAGEERVSIYVMDGVAFWGRPRVDSEGWCDETGRDNCFVR